VGTTLLLLVVSCSSSSPGVANGTGGATGAGGGTSAGGGGGTGGLGGSGGTTGVGGATGVGGSSGQGWATAVGGATGSGGITGTTSSGGALGMGGASPTGGAPGTGGAVTGGVGVTGGSTGRGGATGTTSSGGQATGGATGTTGGTGGLATGGTTGTGTTSTGGVTGTGGTTASGPAIAFPGAQGFGKKATGGRNGVVYHVTNLNDAGAGSFRDAVSASNRIIVFDVGGYIQLATAVGTKSNLTIAGQTAPGGIGFRGGELSFATQSNIIMRHVRIRPGSETESTDDDALSLYRANTVIVDHTSMEFGPWNNIDGVGDDASYRVRDVTFQDSLVADPTGQQFGAHCESLDSSWAFFRNIFANSHNRNPLAKVNDIFINNLLYNYQAGYTTHTSSTFSHDIVNNYFVMGPSSGSTDNTWYQIDQNQSIYTSGNLKDTNKNGVLDGFATTPYWYQGEGTVLTRPWSTETTAYPTLDTPSAARVAMSRAGAFPRDQLDALIISQVLTLGKGSEGGGAGSAGKIYTTQADTGLPNNGYGTIAGGTRPTDSDNDGMPDTWEGATGSDPGKDDAMTKASDGYALIEHYINWLAEPHATAKVDASVDVDLGDFADGFSTVSPAYTVSSAQNGTVALQSDSHTARFQPGAGFQGLGSFTFTVAGSDGTKYSDEVVVLVAP
jgi:hypothetical protein